MGSDWSPMRARQVAVDSLACTCYWVPGLVCYLGLALGGPWEFQAPAKPTWGARCPLSPCPGKPEPAPDSAPARASCMWAKHLPVYLKFLRTTTLCLVPAHRVMLSPAVGVDTWGALRASPAALVSLLCSYERSLLLVPRSCPREAG